MNNNFLSRLVMLLGAVVLSCNVAWGDNGDFYEVYMTANVAGTGSDGKNNFAENLGTSGFTEKQLGNLTSDFVITGVYLKCWDDWGDNYKSEGGQMCYKIGSSGSVQYWTGFTRSSKNGNNYEYQKTGELVVGDVDGPSGNYTAEFWFQTWGSNWGDRYINNGGSNYKFSYTILPPTVKQNTPAVSAEGFISGDGSKNSPWLVTVGQTLTLTGTAEPDWTDANSGLRISNNSDTKTNYQTSLVFNSDVVTEKCTVTVKFKYYNASADLISSNSRSKTIYYQFVQPRTVNFNAGTGSVTPTSLTEETYGAGITLPSATPQPDCITAGWTFAGWAESQQTETTTAPTLFAADTNYKPSGDVTLYAVYKITQGGTLSDDFVKVTSAPTDWSGDYIIAKETNAMNGTLTSGKFGNTTVEITDNTITSTNTSIIWTFTVGTTAGQYSLKNNSANKYANITGTSTDNAALSDDPVYFTVESSSTAGIWKVVSVDYNERCFSYYSSNWRTYAKSNYTTGNLYKRAAGSGTTTYNSNPSEGVKCSINWMVEGKTYHTDLLNNGDAINKPVTDPESINNRVFVGWSSEQIIGHANTFTDFTPHNCTGAQETWYAVFATPEYTEANAIADGGTYIITSQKNDKTVYLPNAAATGDSPILGTAIDVNENKISTVVTPDMLWTFNSIEGGWQIQSVAEPTMYLGTTSNNGKYVRVNTSYNMAWTIADNTMKYNTTNNFIGPYTDDDHWYANNSSTSNKFASTTITFYTPVNSYRNYTTAPNTATYSVVYDLNGGTGTAINKHELLTGASVTLPTAPSRLGYSFAGWNDGSQTYAAGASYTIGSANVTLTAQWGTLTPTSITITVPQEVVNAELTVGQAPVQLGLTFEPAGLSEGQKAVTWSVKSGDESLISVTQEGLVSALACGESATVYATSNVDANIKGEYIFHIKTPACENYSFHYGNNNGSGWNYYCDPICFTESEVSDGTQTGHFWFADFVLPADDKEFYVGWQNNWATNEQNYFASAKDNFSNMYFHHYHKVNATQLGSFDDLANAGAIGKLCVWGGYTDNNKYVDFVPGGYVLRLGSGENWTSYEFAPNDATNILETTWTTDFITLTSEIISGHAYVALKANNTAGFVSTPNQTEDKEINGKMGIKTGAGESWQSGNITNTDAGRHGKFRIWVDNNTKNFCCHFVPYYQIAFNTDGGSAVAPGYVSIEADSKSYTVTMSPETNPTRTGYQFAGWNDGSTTHTTTWTIENISDNINLTAEWNKVNTLTFHYEGFTTDCDEQRSVATGEQVTLPNGKAVAGKTFDGWSDGNTTYQAGASYTMPANDVTLTATYTNWTITLNYNGTTQTPEVPETGVVLPTEAQGEAVINNIFIGFTKNAVDGAITDLPADFIAAGETYSPVTAGETLYALYRQGDTEYKLIKDIKDLRLGAHVVLASIDEDYAMGKDFIVGQDTLPAIVVTKDGDNETISFGKDVQEWVLDASDSKNHVGEWSFKQGTDSKYLAAPSVGKDKLSLASSKTATACFTLAIDASGRVTAKSVVATSTTTHNTLSMGENGFFACYNPNTIDAPDFAIYQHIGTKYVTTPTAVYRVKSVDMVNGRIDKNDYYVVNDTITLSGYANEGYSTSNVYRVYGEAAHDTISKTRGFRMPAYNVVDTLTNRAFVDTLKFVVPECVTNKSAIIRANINSEVSLPTDIANVNAWRFVGWTKTAIIDTLEVHSEIFTTTYMTPSFKKDSSETFYAIYSYDGLETTGFVLSTVYNATTYYLGEYVSSSNNRYFSAVTDKAQALVLYLEEIEAIEAIEAIERKLYYNSGDAKVYLKADNSGSTNILTTTNEADATIWTITENQETGVIAITSGERCLRFNYNNGNNSRYNIYSIYNDPVKEKAPSYTSNPVCAQYAYYFVSDGAETPEYVYELGQDGKVIPYSPANECDAKRFIGWSETTVTALQQSAPSMVDVATQTYDRDVNLYAVYAAPNGGKVVDTPTITDDVTAMGSFKTAQDSGMTSLNARYYYHNAELYDNTLRLKNGKGLDSSYITTSLIRDLEKIQVVHNTNNIKPIVSISSDGSNWTQIALNPVSEIYIATPEVAGDYYVAFSIKRSESESYSYSRISSVTYTHNKQYWYSDYSTNCNTVASATMSFQNQEATTVHDPIAAETIGQVITLPTLKVAGQHFDHWTINDVEYEGGESYKLSHDVTAIATMSEAQLVCSPETLFVTSAKGKTVRSSQTIQISCPDITTGTLEIADVTADDRKTTFHAVITDPEASAETGLNATVAIEFTPNAQNVNRNATMTATIGSLQKTFQVRGTSLPDQFVIAYQNNDKWYALPADITAYKTYAGYEITIDNNNNATAPASAVYNLYADSTDETHKHNPEIVRLAAPNGGRALQAQAADKTNIKVGDSIQYAVDSTYKWIIQTTDNENYTFLNAKTGRALNYSGDKFGTYQNGESLRIFKVETTTATIPVTVTNWTENSFSFTTTETIPVYDNFRLLVNDVVVETASCTPNNTSYEVTSSTAFTTQQIVQLQWYNNSTLVATASVVTPARVTENTTLSSLLTEGIDTKSLDIVVASGSLTVDAKATIHNLDIYPGATVAITNDTLTTTTLSFHGGLTSTESNYDYEVPRLYIQKENYTDAPGYIKMQTHVYYYLNVNSDHFYPFTVPYKTTIANIRYASKPNTIIQSVYGKDKAIVISEYNGEARGKGAATTTKYWNDLSYSNDLIPGVGYIITAKRLKGESYASLRIMMMVSDIDATTDTVAVGAWGVGQGTTTAWYNQGWNYIANPYTAMLAGNNADDTHHAIQSGTEVRYATVPSPVIDGYDQVPMTEANLKPFYGFFIQAGNSGNYHFVKNIHNGAPAYLLAEEKPEQEAYISLEGAAMRDRFGLIVGPGHTNDYEINADLTKELGSANDLRAWLMAGETKMAYLAVDDETARTLIPLNLRTPSEGEYTFSIRESSRVEDLEGVYLYDYENGTVTNIINSDYTFSAPAGAVENRFALSAIRQNKAPTDIGGQTDGRIGREAERLKIVKDGHIYIIVNGVTFNAEGKEITK